MKLRLWLAVAAVLTVLSVSAARRALVVGVSDYPRHRSVPAMSWSPVHGAEDAAMMDNALRDRGFAVTILTDKRATAAGIRSALRALLTSAKRGDVVVFHFSGHGQPVEDADGDEADGWDEALVAYDAWRMYRRGVYHGENHILDDELNTFFTALRRKVGPRGMVYAFIDACHSGGASRGDEVEEDAPARGAESGLSASGRRYVPRIDRRGNIRIPAVKGGSPICVIEACRAYQTNSEIKVGGRWHGPLTYYITRCLPRPYPTADLRWTDSLRRLMEGDPRLLRQNPVIEFSR